MAKDMERDKRMFVGVIWNCAAELKLLLTALLFLCSLATVFQFLPSRLTFSVSDLRHCINDNVAENVTLFEPVSPIVVLQSVERDQVMENGVLKRGFNTFGTAAYSFVLMSAYRGGIDTFAVLGLASKPLHVYGKPSYQCEWIDGDGGRQTTAGHKILPDWGYGRIYTVVVINCTFSAAVGGGSGGKLVIHANTNGGGDRNFNRTDTIEAHIEPPNTLNTSIYSSPPKYDYLYCGSSLFGNLSPQRVREWLAFHIKLFGEKSHFVIHDAGGVHADVMEVFKPWIEKGYVTLQDIREEGRFDGYYHNQFLIVNDCLHRYRFTAKWMFFFDVDEFIFVPKKSTIKTVMDSLSDFTQFTIEQMPMSNKLCLSEDTGKSYRKWGFEKLVFKDSKTGIRRDRKYAIQPRNVFATGVHMSENTIGNTTHKTEGKIMYYHYHGTINERREPCRKMVDSPEIKMDGLRYIVDPTMREAAGAVKRFELKMIGSRLQKTRQ